MRNAWYKLCIVEPVDFEYKKNGRKLFEYIETLWFEQLTSLPKLRT